MLLKDYEAKGLLLNISFVDQAKDSSFAGFRGRLALVEGEVADDSGNKKPPAIVMEHTVLLSKDDKLQLLAGSLDKLESLSQLVEMYQQDFAEDMLAIIFVVNLTKSVQVELGGAKFALIPMVEGITWNELMDFAALDKLDIKKMSSGEKVYTVYSNLSDFKPQGDSVSFDDALALTADITRVERGAL